MSKDSDCVREKNIYERMKELEDSLNLLKIANNEFCNKKKCSLLVIMAQLRALICTGNNHNYTPLLLNLSEELEIPLEIYVQSQDYDTQDLCAVIKGSKNWFINNYKEREKMLLKEWLNMNSYYISRTKEFKSRNELIKVISNKQGGSHYDNMIHNFVDELNRQTIGDNESDEENNGVEIMLLDVASAVYFTGMKMGYMWYDLQNELNPVEDPRIIELYNNFRDIENKALSIDIALYGEDVE